MHTNHRRKNVFHGKHHGKRYYQVHLIYSCRYYRRVSWQQRRAQARLLMFSEQYDDLPTRYRRDIYWRYW